MSSSFIVEPKEKSKKDDTLIIVVNDDGTISVDHETLQNIIINQSNANVSVVRLGQGDADAENGDITLTVDPPAYVPPESSSTVTGPGSTDPGVGGLVDPFMEMDPEQLERLETALQSEEAKQILGENVTAMLDMLSVEEEQNSLKYSIQLDHCYTSRKSPSDPKPSDPLPIAESPEIKDTPPYSSSSSLSSSLPASNVPSGSTPTISASGTSPSPASGKSKLTKSGRGPGRPRKDGRPPGSTPTTPKSTANAAPRNVINVLQHGVNKGALVPLIKPLNMNDVRIGSGGTNPEAVPDAVLSSSSESSESEPPSDDDSDFGPRGPRRSGVRARGGRKGLTTRGGSLAASRRRGTNKHMDMEQVRRLDMEMAAAVDAMKSPEKEDKTENRLTPTKAKKSLKTLSAKKKEDSSLQPVAQIQPTASASSPVAAESQISGLEKPLITTNQVKANLINANTIKGDMILTKPGQMKNNQKVIFVQKQVMMKASELKNLGIKKPIVVSKTNLISQVNLKSSVLKEPKVQSPVSKVVVQPTPAAQPSLKVLTQTVQPAVITQQQPQIISQAQSPQIQQNQVPQMQKVVVLTNAVPSLPKPKTPEAKKEKKKLEIITDVAPKVEPEAVRPPEPKTPDGTKKHRKSEHRKSPAHLVDALGPALFSTPDIIRRVGSGNEPKTPEAMATSPSKTVATSMPFPVSSSLSSPVVPNPAVSVTATLSQTPLILTNVQQTQEAKITNMNTLEDSIEPHLRLQVLQVQNDSPDLNDQEDDKIESKAPLAEELQASLDAVSHEAPTTEVLPASVNQHLVPENNLSVSSGIEGEEHLLATLEMEASKHEEELLAEALLLQEELGDDLGDHSALVDQASAVTEALLPSGAFAPLADIPATVEPQTLSPVRTIPAPQPAVLSSPTSAAPVTAVAPSVPEVTKKTPRDEKEGVQIVRGGRIITLPPIEAPATRSKRLQAKGDTPQRRIEAPKKVEKTIKFAISHQEIPNKDEMESEMEEDDEDGDNSDSEDDPDRLWCICKRPHNNRFMISCDVCEDWFHGKCVHVSKAMGQQMEEKGIEWICPNCLKKKSDDTKEGSSQMSPEFSKPNKTTTDLTASPSLESMQEISPSPVRTRAKISSSSVSQSSSASAITPSSSPILPSSSNIPGVTQCVVCKKEARNSSIYCSDGCILTHAQESLTKDKPTATPSPQAKPTKTNTIEIAKTKPDGRVIVFERKSGKVLTGMDAPTTSNLKTWLKENPTYEVVRPNNLNTLQIGGKTVTAIQTPGTGKVTKTVQQMPGKGQGQVKMVYAKVAGSKQTVLAPSNKKLVIVTSGQSMNFSPQGKQQIAQSRQTLLTPTLKNPQFSAKQSPFPRQQKLQLTPTTAGTPPTPKQVQSKKGDSKPSTSHHQTKIQPKSSISKRPETEPIRLNIRKTLAELLSSRIKETEDLKLGDEEIKELALNIELEMYKFFKDTGAKYKAKYRSLVFNIKDTKNLTLFRKIADKSLAPDAVVRLSPDEMASQELAEWREKETKHQLEMIKKNELDLMAQAKSIVVKTHKGEQIIENDGGIDHVDPKTPVQDIVTALNSGDSITSSSNIEEEKEEREKGKAKHETKKNSLQIIHSDKKKEKEKGKEKEKEKEKHERSRSRSRRHHSRDSDSRSKTRERSKERERRSTRNKDSKRDKDKEREREREKEKEREREKQKEKDSKHKKSRNTSTRNRSRGRHREHNSKDTSKKEEDRTKKESAELKEDPSAGLTEKPIPIEDRLWRHIEDETTTTNTLDGNESDVSDREPSSTVTIKTPDFNEELEKEKEEEEEEENPPESSESKNSTLQTVWRGFVNMVDVAKFFITAQEVSGHARDLMEDLPDTVDVVGRISHETVWDYISKMKRTGSKEILIIRLTAANDEEKIPYITLYSYLNSRSRLGVVGNVSKNIKDFYIMPFSSQSTVPSVLLPLDGPGFEEHRPHLLLGIIVRNKRKRPLISMPMSIIPSKIAKIDAENRGYTPPLVENLLAKDISGSVSMPPDSPTNLHPHAKSSVSVSAAVSLEASRKAEKQKNVTQSTLESLNKAHVGMSRNAIMENAAKISKIVPELSMKIGVISPAPQSGGNKNTQNSDLMLLQDDDDGDEPYSPGEMDDDNDDDNQDLNKRSTVVDPATTISLSPTKNSTELQRKMDELNRQIEEQKQQIQNISSSFLGDATATLPGLGLDPPGINDSEEAYSPTDTRSFTPPPPGIPKISQPILDKVSNITIPANLQEILANVKRQESSKVDPYLPSKPSATFLTSVNASAYQKPAEKYSASTMYGKNSQQNINTQETQPQASTHPQKENKSTLRSLSDLDLIKKAEEELAAVAAAAAASASVSSISNSSSSPSGGTVLPALTTRSSLPIISAQAKHMPPSPTPVSSISQLVEAKKVGAVGKAAAAETAVKKKNLTFDQPKPPGLEDEDFSLTFPAISPTATSLDNSGTKKSSQGTTNKFVPKSGVVLSVKRKNSDEISTSTSTGSLISNSSKTPRTRSRWGQGPGDQTQ